MNKMTDNHIAADGKKVEEVVKALEFCSHCVCDDDKTETKCPYYNMSFCKNYLRKQSLEVIKQQQAEIEKLKAGIEEEHSISQSYSDLCDYKQKEIERLKKAVEIHKGIAEDWKYEAKKLKEMVGEGNG